MNAEAASFHLDGLLEGRYPPIPGTESKLRAWPAETRRAGYPFTVDLKHGRFSVLPETKPIPLRGAVVADPVQAVSDLLEGFLRTIPAGERGDVRSTIRSVEYRAATVVETAYAVTPDGTIETVSRERPWTPPAEPQGLEKWKPWLWRGGIALALVTLFLFTTGFFSDPMGALEQWGFIERPPAPAPTLDTAGIRDLLAIEVVDITDGRLTLLARPTADLPRSLREYEDARRWSVRLDDTEAWRALEAAFQGRIEVEYRDEHDVAFARVALRVPPWGADGTATFVAPWDSRHPAARLVILP